MKMYLLTTVLHMVGMDFLWAGQTTMDNGKGGCNDNYIVQNDLAMPPQTALK